MWSPIAYPDARNLRQFREDDISTIFHFFNCSIFNQIAISTVNIVKTTSHPSQSIGYLETLMNNRNCHSSIIFWTFLIFQVVNFILN